MSLKAKILEYVRNQSPNFIHGAELERFGQGLGFMASNVLRRARELEKEGLIEKRYNASHEVEYRAKQESPPEYEKVKNELEQIYIHNMPPEVSMEVIARINQMQPFKENKKVEKVTQEKLL